MPKNKVRKTKRDIPLKEDGLEYASILRILGNSRIEAYCFGNQLQLLLTLQMV